MPFAFGFITILLAAMPVLALSDDWLVQDISTLAAALLLWFATKAPPDDLKNTVRLLRPAGPALLFPVAWMVLQIVPLNPFANSIWLAASIALDESLPGHISIDPSATIRSMFGYLTAVSLMVATMVFTRDRESAETTLFVTCAVTTFMSIETLLGRFDALAGIAPVREAQFMAAGALGAIVNTTAAIRIIERRFRRGEDAVAVPFVLIGVCLAACASCLGAIAIAGQTNTLIITGFGIAVVLLVGIGRLIALRRWSIGVAFAILTLMAAGMIAVRIEDITAGTAVLRFAAGAPADSISVTQRALSDATWAGSGAGTFGALVPIYREFGSIPAVEPASSIAKGAIELGRAALIALLLLAAQIFCVLLQGALRRGRDWYFPAAAAACVVALVGEAFCDLSLTRSSNQIIVAVIIGLGLSQTKGRTSGL